MMAETNRKELKRMFMIEKGETTNFQNVDLIYLTRTVTAKFKDNYGARVNLENQ